MLARWIALAIVLAGCSAEATSADEEAPDQGDEAVVYGKDNRKEVYAADARLAAIARRSMVAILDESVVDTSDPDHVKLTGDTLGKSENLCSTEKFRSEPAPADCSGTLIADDLVLTAGHCFEGDDDKPHPAEMCKKMRIAFGFHYDAPGKLHRITADDVFSCKEVLAYSDADDDTPSPWLDFAVIRLDRSAAPNHVPLRPVASPASIANGKRLVVIGAPSGIPLKIDDGGTVLDGRPAFHDYFSANTDTFHGNSGSGVLDLDTLSLVGLLVSGNDDDYVQKGSCRVVNRCASEGCKKGRREVIGYVKNPIDALCKAHPDEQPCATLAP